MKKINIVIILIIIVLAAFLGIKYFDKSERTSEGVLNNIEETVEEKNQAKDISITMAVTGDIMCHNTMYKDAYDLDGTYDFNYYFDNVKKYLEKADIAIGNLETTFAGSAIGYSSYPTFNTPEALGDAIKNSGIDIVSTANNHCIDKGYRGIESTIDYLDKIQLDHTGTYKSEEDQGKILVKDVNGIKMAFISFTYGTNGIPVPKDKEYAVNLISDDLIISQIELAKKEKPDVICASMHWGIEYQTKQNAEQERLANLLFENGVDIILGNHPHVLQPMEKRDIVTKDGKEKTGFVIFSLGNFMADQNKSYTRDSAIVNIEITKHGKDGSITIDDFNYVPTYIYNSRSGKNKNFAVLDIKECIEKYENGDKSISKSLYDLLNSELKNIEEILK